MDSANNQGSFDEAPQHQKQDQSLLPPPPSRLAVSHPTTPRSRQTSSSTRPFSFGSLPYSSPPPPPPPLSLSRFSSSSSSTGTGFFRCMESWSKCWRGLSSVIGSRLALWSARESHQMSSGRRRKVFVGGKTWQKRKTRSVVMWSGVLAFFFIMNWWMFSRLQEPPQRRRELGSSNATLPALARPSILDSWSLYEKNKRPMGVMHTRLLALAAHALAEAESKPEPTELWKEPTDPVSSWTPCAHQRNWQPCEGQNGYIKVSANGGINQQRVAICNAVAVARLLNASLVVPQFLYNSVWRDTSQFSDIYQEEHFINILKPDIQVVNELPPELQSLDLEAIGSLVTDVDVMKEAKPSFYLKNILPILLKNRVVHFVGFGNRLTFDPVPFDLQRLRCRCNFHALRFVDKIQKAGALLVHRLHGHQSHSRSLEQNLLGPYAEKLNKKGKHASSRYLAVHLRFEIDMVAYSMCYFGGGKEEEDELEAYRAIHFPALTLLRNTTKVPSASSLRTEGQCPLTPEEAVLMLAALGFKRRTKIFVAGAQIYGGKLRMAAISSLYPNLVTKERLLSSSEIEQFRNFSSQLAALDFIVCAAADAFAMTDSGSQLSSLVSGYRMYYGGGNLLTIRPNKRRLASIFSKNSTIEWKEFEGRVRKSIKQTKQVIERPVARSVYRHPRCPECMCRI